MTVRVVADHQRSGHLDLNGDVVIGQLGIDNIHAVRNRGASRWSLGVFCAGREAVFESDGVASGAEIEPANVIR